VRELRAGNGLPLDDFQILTPLADAYLPEHFARAAQAGITGNVTMPWMFYSGPQATTAEKIDGMRRFRADMGLDG
jgi:hypothetical protein